MAHTCPECSALCYCGGDIDDCQMDGTEDQLRCSHCDDEDKECDDDPSEEEDNRRFSEPITNKPMTDQPLKDALQAVLLFHSASPWEGEKVYEWQRICRSLLGDPEYGKSYSPTYIGGFDASTRTLCDMVRAALKQTETQTIP